MRPVVTLLACESDRSMNRSEWPRSRSVSAPSSVTNTSPCWNGDIVPGSTLMYGSSLMLVTRMLRDSRIAAREAAAIPLPREETTPPVTKTYLAIYPARVGIKDFTGFSFWRLVDLHPVRLDPVVGAMYRAHILAHRPRNHLPVQRHMVDLCVVLGERIGDELLALSSIVFHPRGVDQLVELLVDVAAPIEVAVALGVRAVQYRHERRLGVGNRPAPSQHVHAGVPLLHPGEVDRARLGVDLHPQADLGQHSGHRDADLLVVDVAVVRAVEREAKPAWIAGLGE